MRARTESLLLAVVGAALLLAAVASPAAAAQAGGRCDESGTDAPVAEAQVRCDAASGWRLSAWIGESGDGIVRVEHAAPAWATVFEGPFCTVGVAAATPDQLVRLGMPPDLAAAWGHRDDVCDPSALARTGTDPFPLAVLAVTGLVVGAGMILLARVGRKRA